MTTAPAAVAVLRSDFNRHLAVEVARGEQSVAYLTIDGAGVSLCKVTKREFDKEFCFDVPMGKAGIEPTPRHWCRTFFKSSWQITEQALPAMLTIMRLSPDESVHRKLYGILVAEDGSFLGAYEPQDVEIVRPYYNGAHVVHNPQELRALPAAQFEKLKEQVAPALKVRDPKKLTQGVFDMAGTAQVSEATAPTPKAVAKTTKERKPKAEGPIAKVKKYVDDNAAGLKSGKITRADARAALLNMGINKSTIGVQLPKWLEINKIDAQKGDRVVVKDGKATVQPKPEPKPKAPKAAKAPAAAAPAKPAAKAPAAKKPAAKAPAKKPAGKKK